MLNRQSLEIKVDRFMYVLLPSRVMKKKTNEKKGNISWRYSDEEVLTYVNMLNFKICRNTHIPQTY